jgi:hypothetical protein
VGVMLQQFAVETWRQPSGQPRTRGPQRLGQVRLGRAAAASAKTFAITGRGCDRHGWGFEGSASYDSSRPIIFPKA